MRVIWGLLAVAVIATMGWGGYWFVGARAMDSAIARVLQSNPSISASSHSLNGFPNRFDLTLTEPRIEQGEILWRAPFIQFFALSYRLNHVIAVFANDQHITAYNQELTLHTADMRASLVMEPGLSLPLERFALVAEAPALRIGDETHRADTARLASRMLDTRHHAVVIEIENAFPDASMMAALDPEGHWPRRFDVIRIEGEAAFDRPLDRRAFEGTAAQLTGLALTGGRLAFESVSIGARGRLEPDAGGYLSGDVTLVVTDWRALMRRARDAGLMPAEHDMLVTLALQSMTDPQNPDRLEVPLSVHAGDVMLGPVVLGSIPPLF